MTASFLHTSVLASTLVIPLILFSWYLVWQLLASSTNSTLWLGLLTITLTAGIFLYIYIPVAYLILFLIGLRLTGQKFTRRQLLLFMLVILVAFANPHNLITTTRYSLRQFSSSDREINLLQGMQGNLGNYLSPFMATSTWFSHPIYLVQGMRVSNQWLVAIIIFLFILSKPKITFSKTLFQLTFPALVFVGLSLTLTHSPYQNAKALQFLAVLFPLVLYLIYTPSFKRLFPTIGYVLLTIISLAGGLYASSYIGKPIVEYDLSLYRQPFCASGLTVIGRDEWAKYFLSDCNDVYYYLDRSMSWDRVVAFNRHNQLTFISQANCEPASLILPGNPIFTDPYLLVDRCIRFDDPAYTPLYISPTHTIFLKSKTN